MTKSVARVLLYSGWCLFAMRLAFPVAGIAQGAVEEKPKVSEKPMTADQLAVYRVVLSGWMNNGKGKHAVLLSVETAPFALDGVDADCGKELGLEAGPKGEVHRFRAEDLPQLMPSRVKLVDPDAQSKEVAENDPEKKIQSGSSIGDAVANGFAHGLVTLGEIRFDKERTHAVVWYGFTCGALCGNGATVILEKQNGKWSVKDHCSNWVS